MTAYERYRDKRLAADPDFAAAYYAATSRIAKEFDEQKRSTGKEVEKRAKSTIKELSPDEQ